LTKEGGITMKYRIIYWLGSMTTEYVVKANNEEEAVKKFKEVKGDKNIIEIIEIKEAN
jgi:hypothetical protein